jgi:hypothetical protein
VRTQGFSDVFFSFHTSQSRIDEFQVADSFGQAWRIKHKPCVHPFNQSTHEKEAFKLFTAAHWPRVVGV